MNRKRIERINRIEEQISALHAELRKETRRAAREDRIVIGTPLTLLTGALVTVVLLALSNTINFGL